MIFLLWTFIIINLATYALRKPKTSIEDGTNFDKDIVIGEFYAYIRVNIIKEKSAYLWNQLLKEPNYFSSEFGIEPVFTYTKPLRRHLEINFPEVMCFFNYGKFVIVYSADTNPCHCAVSTLKGTGLRNRDLTSAFAKMIRSSVESDLENQDEEWPMSPNELAERLNTKPICDSVFTV